jgi:hypothetical protein
MVQFLARNHRKRNIPGRFSVSGGLEHRRFDAWSEGRRRSITCAISLLGWPAWNGLLRQFEGLEFYGILEVVPVMIGGFLALIIRKQAARHR